MAPAQSTRQTAAALPDADADHASDPESRKPSKRRPVTVHVNERPVKLRDRRTTGLEIKTEAKAQGVPIELDFILVQELRGERTKVIGDQDEVHVKPSDRFLANDGDDNS